MNKRAAPAEPCRLKLSGEVTICRATELKAELLAALDQHPGLELNLAEVIELDTAGVQLLLLLKRTAEENGKAMHLVAHSDAVANVFELLNLAPYFGDPIVMPPPATASARGQQHA